MNRVSFFSVFVFLLLVTTGCKKSQFNYYSTLIEVDLNELDYDHTGRFFQLIFANEGEIESEMGYKEVRIYNYNTESYEYKFVDIIKRGESNNVVNLFTKDNIEVVNNILTIEIEWLFDLYADDTKPWKNEINFWLMDESSANYYPERVEHAIGIYSTIQPAIKVAEVTKKIKPKKIYKWDLKNNTLTETGEKTERDKDYIEESDGSIDCSGNYAGPEFDIQIDSQCKAAYAYKCAGNQTGVDAACSIYKDFQRQDSTIPNCPYCN